MKLRAVLGRRSVLLPVFAVVFVLALTATASAQDADLTVVKSTDSSIVVAGAEVSYDLSVSNFSGTPSTPTNTLTDVIPAGMTFVSETHPDGWSCTTPATGSGGSIICTFDGAIQDESSVVFNFVLKVPASATNGDFFTNTVTISHQGSDPNSENNQSSATVTVGTPPPTPVPLAPHDVLISEFRLSGPGGTGDEYIEFYCNRDIPCDLTGSTIRSYDPAIADNFIVGFPPNTIIPPRQFLLIADFSQYSLFDYAVPDIDVNCGCVPDFFIDNQGIQLIGAEEGILIDSVGFIGGGNDNQYIEGTGLQPSGGITPSRPPDQYAYVRKRTMQTNGLPQDTNNNADDFVLVSVTGNPHPGISTYPVLGAPGPKSLTSPTTYSNAQVPASFVEPAADPHESPNRVRTGSGDTGTLSIRRTITNNTNQAFDYIAFRVIEIPTLNSPDTVGDHSQLRLITSANAETFTNSEARTVFIRGTILEFDASCDCEPQQPNGGGLNSTVHVDLSDEAIIAPGQKVDVQFLFNVVHAGAYRFFVYVEAFPTQQQPDNPNAPATNRRERSAVSANPPTARRMINLKRGIKPVVPFTKKPKLGGLPTKAGAANTQPLVLRPIINLPSAGRNFPLAVTPASTTPQRRKNRVRRKSRTALRARAEAKPAGELPASQ
jgi:uncharacterized repeat protein (TIGR01451 family)